MMYQRSSRAYTKKLGTISLYNEMKLQSYNNLDLKIIEEKNKK
jgi:hypothetical protein